MGSTVGCGDIDGVIEGALLGALGWTQVCRSKGSQLKGTTSGLLDPRTPSSTFAMNSQRALTVSIGGFTGTSSMFSFVLGVAMSRPDTSLASFPAVPILPLEVESCHGVELEVAIAW